MLLVEADALVLPDGLQQGLALGIRAGRIEAIAPTADLVHQAGDRVHIDGTLLPGVIDLQVNGADGVDVQAAGPEELERLARRVLQGGACAFLPTLITAPFEELLKQLRVVADWIDSNHDARSALPLGIHLEGPFLEIAGAHPPEALLEPSPERVEALLEASQGQLRLVTLAPDLAGAPQAVQRFVQAGVCVSIGHASSHQQLNRCLEAGATVATHLYNVMGPLHHRKVGLAHRVLDDARMSACLIPDHLHVHPIMLRQAWKVLGPERTILVTDCMAAAGMPDGTYHLSGQPVTLAEDQVRDSAGNLAGSAILMDRALDGFAAAVPECDSPTLARIASQNPARALGLPEPNLAVGQPARFTVRSGTGTYGLRFES